MVFTYLLPHRVAQAGWEISASGCHNRLSALALSEVGEDPCGLIEPIDFIGVFPIAAQPDEQHRKKR